MYLATLLLTVVLSVCVIMWYEGNYTTAAEANQEGGQQHISEAEDTGINRQEIALVNDTIALVVVNSSSDDRVSSHNGSAKSAPPEWLDRIMGLVYPGSLGIDEGIAHLTMKAVLSMLDTCGAAQQCDMGIIYIFVIVWVSASVGTLWWLRRVFSRYEATSALPVEYGSVNAISVCSGLLYYQESRCMTQWQLGLIIVGVAVILFGISIGRLQDLPTSYHSLLQLLFSPSPGNRK